MSSDSYFSFDQPATPRSGDDSPLLSPGSTEPPLRFSALSSALFNAPSSSASGKSVAFSLGDMLGQRRDKQPTSTQASTLSPTNHNNRMGFAFRRLSRITGISRPSSKQMGESVGKQSTIDVRLNQLPSSASEASSNSKSSAAKHEPKNSISMPSAQAPPPSWLREDDSSNQQDATGLFNRSGRRTGISLAHPNTYSEAPPSHHGHPTDNDETNMHASQQSIVIPPAARHQTFSYSLPRRDTAFPPQHFPVPDRTLSYLPTEAQRIATPPASAEPRLDPFTLKPTPRMSSPMGKASQNRGLTNTAEQQTSGHRLRESEEQDTDEEDIFRRKWVYSTATSPGAANIIDDSIPEHLPSSPLCPRHPKHKSGGRGTCPYHGRNMH